MKKKGKTQNKTKSKKEYKATVRLDVFFKKKDKKDEI